MLRQWSRFDSTLAAIQSARSRAVSNNPTTSVNRTLRYLKLEIRQRWWRVRRCKNGASGFRSDSHRKRASSPARHWNSHFWILSQTNFAIWAERLTPFFGTSFANGPTTRPTRICSPDYAPRRTAGCAWNAGAARTRSAPAQAG
jgi:hypothetical protein